MMQHLRYLPPLSWLGLAVIVCLCVACSTKGSNYVGRWECSSGGGNFFEIKSDNDAFLVSDETGATYPASVNEKGILVLSGVPLLGSLPLPIDSDSGELICSIWRCNRYKKVK